MTDRAWEELVDRFDQRFGLKNFHKKTEPVEDNHKLTKTLETIEFSHDGNDFRVVRITAPLVVDRKTFYHRTGQSDHSQNIYDETETSHRVVFYKQAASGDWEEISPESLLS